MRTIATATVLSILLLVTKPVLNLRCRRLSTFNLFLRSVELIQISQIYTLKVLSPLCGVNTDLTFVVSAVILPASTATACQRGLTRHPQAFYVSAKLSATCRNDCSCRLRCCSEMSQVSVSRRSYRHLHRRIFHGGVGLFSVPLRIVQ